MSDFSATGRADGKRIRSAHAQSRMRTRRIRIPARAMLKVAVSHACERDGNVGGLMEGETRVTAGVTVSIGVGGEYVTVQDRYPTEWQTDLSRTGHELRFAGRTDRNNAET